MSKTYFVGKGLLNTFHLYCMPLLTTNAVRFHGVGLRSEVIFYLVQISRNSGGGVGLLIPPSDPHVGDNTLHVSTSTLFYGNRTGKSVSTSLLILLMD
jgi:hypothetical protein